MAWLTACVTAAVVTALKPARDAGILVVNIDNRLDDDVLKQEGLKVPFVGPDNRAGARRVGEALAARLHAAHPATVVVLISVEEQCDLPTGAGSSGAATMVRKQDLSPTALKRLWTLYGNQ